MGRSWIRGRLLGAGAFGQVNLAMDRETGGFFAVKSTLCSSSKHQHHHQQQQHERHHGVAAAAAGGDLQDVGAAEQSSLAAMENEIHILQSLPESEFVVRCLGSDWSEEEGGQRMRNVFLEYMPGGSLSDVLKQFAGAQPLSEALIRSYTRSILQGVDYLHRHGIVHCDIKGRNVLVGNAGKVKLADFGSAKYVNGEKTATTSAAASAAPEDGLRKLLEFEDCGMRKVNGTPLWMAPEVVLQKEQGLPSDIWSLGCTVVEMATGQAPWAQIANPFVALYHIGCTDEVPAVPASLSPAAQDFLSRCFQRDPRTRWTSSQLLEHPFLTQGPELCSDVASPAPTSPTSVLELEDHHGSSSSCSSSSSAVFSTLGNSVPRLASPRFWKLAAFQSPRGKKKQDVVVEQKQQQGGETSSSDGTSCCSNDWWGTSPLSPCTEGGEQHWIVVRSPTGNNSIPHKKFEEEEEEEASTAVVVAAPAITSAETIITSSAHNFLGSTASLQGLTVYPTQEEEELHKALAAEAVAALLTGAHCTSLSTEASSSPPPLPPSMARALHSTEGNELALQTCPSSGCSGFSLKKAHQNLLQSRHLDSASISARLDMVPQVVSFRQNHILQCLAAGIVPVGGTTEEKFLAHTRRRRRRRRRRRSRIQVQNKVSSPWFSECYYKHLTSFSLSQDLLGLGCNQLIRFMKIANSINFLTLVLFCFCLCALVCSQIFTQILCCFSTPAFQNTHEIFCVLVSWVCVQVLDTAFDCFSNSTKVIVLCV
ncbi:unnamed protein product [Sphagnum troendelagicum]|uniref:Protein kinase domain-containing protein n=1 Tax=Sphagnum troendelagicum TaxID=128251 RepID=A0ABP0UI44_9BRYO